MKNTSKHKNSSSSSNGNGNGSNYNKGHVQKEGIFTIQFLRWTFVHLSIACLFHLCYRGNSSISSSSININTGVHVQSLRQVQMDADAPTVRRIRIPQHQSRQKKPLPPVPKFVVNPLYKKEQDRIDAFAAKDPAAQCARYGVEPLGDKQKQSKRRIFFGSMLANENTEVLVAHAVEVYNKYDVVALVESNTTHSAAARTMNYGPGSMPARTLMESEFFGNADTTKVLIDYWRLDEPNLQGMNREVEQRNVIWKMWVDQGMAPWDIGIMADLDEVVSRDFLNALKNCDFPKMRHNPNKRPSCQTPKMCLSTMQFEGSPLCVKETEWYHPDVILGHCVLGVGDNQGRATPRRVHTIGGDRRIPAGARTGNWGATDYKKYPKDVLAYQRFPLWDGRDMREINGNADTLVDFVDEFRPGRVEKKAVYGTSYHFHNWFRDLAVLRHKYQTYGHPNSNAGGLVLSKIQGDLDMMVRCARELGNDPPEAIGTPPENGYNYYTTNRLLPLPSAASKEAEHKNSDANTNTNTDTNTNHMFTLGGNRPIFFLNRTYVEERHALIQQLIRNDEKQHGSNYK
mmetsp:Transcript_16285/g.33539  ORF Transcript_16285/g.33539 Transcript_16285/m.33539 type:complete len:571 (-) Transcript_16285:70-1782(-)